VAFEVPLERGVVGEPRHLGGKTVPRIFQKKMNEKNAATRHCACSFSNSCPSLSCTLPWCSALSRQGVLSVGCGVILLRHVLQHVCSTLLSTKLGLGSVVGRAEASCILYFSVGRVARSTCSIHRPTPREPAALANVERSSRMPACANNTTGNSYLPHDTYQLCCGRLCRAWKVLLWTCHRGDGLRV
jgi:hypothetical protein